MDQNNDRGRFRVTAHFELEARGAFVVGQITEGVVRIGMKAWTGLEPSYLTVGGVEFLDTLRKRKHWNALVFAERPALEFVKRAFPVGSVIETGIGPPMQANKAMDPTGLSRHVPRAAPCAGGSSPKRSAGLPAVAFDTLLPQLPVRQRRR